MQSDNNFGNREINDDVNTDVNASYTAQPVVASSTTSSVDTAMPIVRNLGEVDTTNASIPEMSDAALQLADDLKKFQKVAAEILANLQPAQDFEQRCNQMFSLANDLFAHAPTWVCFFREVLAVDGLARRLFETNEEFEQFMMSSHYDQVQQMLTALRSRDLPENDPNDPQRMITVRLPKSLHEALCDEAERLNISVNKLCISRLLQVLDQKMVPETVSKPRGRKPRSRVNSKTT